MATPVQPPLEQFTDVFGMILDAEVPLDNLGDPSSSPQFVRKTVKRGALVQEPFQLAQLRIGESAFSTGTEFGREALALASHPAPAVQRGACDAENASQHRRGFALLEQLHGTASSSLQFSSCSFGSHTYILRTCVPNGVFRKAGCSSRDHTLEQRHAFSGDEAARLAAVLPPQSFLIGLSSVHSREAWKYGVRAFRYCQHDVGHALAAVRYAAAALGWSARLLDHLGDDAVATWLGLDQAGFAQLDPLDREHPDALVLVGPS